MFFFFFLLLVLVVVLVDPFLVGFVGMLFVLAVVAIAVVVVVPLCCELFLFVSPFRCFWMVMMQQKVRSSTRHHDFLSLPGTQPSVP